MKRKKGLVGLLIILICLIGCAGYLYYKKYSENTTIIPLRDVISGRSLKSGEAYIFLGDKYMQDKHAVVIENEVYIPIEVIYDIDSKFYYEEDTNELYYTDAQSISKVKLGEKIDGYECVKSINNKLWINFKYLKGKTNAKVGYYTNPDRVVILNDYTLPMAKVIKKGAIRSLTGYKSPVVKNVRDEMVLRLKEFEDWSKVVTEDGSIGYIETNKLSNFVKYIGREDYKSSYKYINLDEKIFLGWHQVTSEAGNAIVNNLVGLNYINVISPTWFSISSNKGDIKSIATSDYVDKMHINGIKVWVLINDFDDSIDINTVLKSYSNRKNIIDSVIAEIKRVDADGINIDFEKINAKGAPSFIQFLRELYLATRKDKIVVSVDNYVPKNFNNFYNRKAQAEVVDYFIIMGYDEHTGKDIGSVSSYTWTKEGIEETLKEAPAKRVINGVPFYTKLWKSSPKTIGNSNTQEMENISFKNIGINAQDKVIKELKGKIKWDKDTRQNYMEVINSGDTYMMWLEDEKSMEEKANLIKENNLAGVAAWKLGLEKESIWKVLKKIK